MNLIRCLLASTALVLPPAFAQQIDFEPSDILVDAIVAPSILIKPVIQEGKASFAYMRSGVNGETVFLAKLTHIDPKPEAEYIDTLHTYDGSFEWLAELDAKPDNQILRSYSVQLGFDFIDLNHRFYDMNTGAYKGFVNEHRFSYLNKSLLASERLQEYQQYELDFGVPADVVDTYDYHVDTEAGNIDLTGFQWNTDNTFSISYLLPVIIELGTYNDYAGDEEFTVNFQFTDTGITVESYGDTKNPATTPLLFPLTLNSRTDYIQFMSDTVYFSTYINKLVSFLFPRTAQMIEAKIPARYQIVYQ